MSKTFTIREVDWETEKDTLSAIRFAVFVEEQGVPAEMELDEYDGSCLHVLAADESGAAIGTARLQRLEEGWAKVGRVAVVKSWRRRGVASALLKRLIDLAVANEARFLKLHGQVRTQPFYESLGFVAEDPVFDECSIPHRLMTLELRKLRAK